MRLARILVISLFSAATGAAHAGPAGKLAAPSATAAPAASGVPAATPAKAGRLAAVPTERVCMVTNRVFPVDQIPVKVAGKTYYGCCEMCKAQLEGQETARKAVDPISKKEIDKADAIIGAAEDGSVVYFESLKTLEAYNAAL